MIVCSEVSTLEGDVIDSVEQIADGGVRLLGLFCMQVHKTVVEKRLDGEL